MPQPVQFQASSPQAVHPQVIYQPESKYGFWGDVGQAFNVAQGVMGLMKGDPREEQVKNEALTMFTDRYDKADSPEAKKDVAKQAMAYADKTGDDRIKAVFSATDPTVLNQKQRAELEANNATKRFDDNQQAGMYDPSQATGSPVAGGGAAAPSSPAAAPAPGGAAPASAQAGPPQNAAPPSAPWAGDPQLQHEQADKSQGMVSPGSDAEPMFHPLQMEVAKVAGVAPQDVTIHETGHGPYPTVNISAIAVNPKLPLDAILVPPPAGPEDAAIQAAAVQARPAMVSWMRDFTSMKLWQKRAANQPVEAVDVLGAAVNEAQAQQIFSDLGLAAGIPNPGSMDLGKVQALGLILSGNVDPSSPLDQSTQQWFNNLSPQAAKLVLPMSSVLAENFGRNKALAETTRHNLVSEASQQVQNAQGWAGLQLKQEGMQFDRSKWEEQKQLSYAELASRENIAANELGVKMEGQDLERAKMAQSERFKQMEQDASAMNRLVQMTGLLGEGDKKAKSYISIAESYRYEIDQTQKAIDANDALASKIETGADPLKDVLGNSIDPKSPKYSEVQQARLQALKDETDRLKQRQKEAIAQHGTYIDKANNELQTSVDPRAQQVMNLLNGKQQAVNPTTGKVDTIPGPNVGSSRYIPPSPQEWVKTQTPGMDAKTFVDALRTNYPNVRTREEAEKLWKQYVARKGRTK